MLRSGDGPRTLAEIEAVVEDYLVAGYFTMT
jgi:hypothetical protein